MLQEVGCIVIAAVIAWMVVGYAAKPADEDHPFGHYKAEYVSAVIEGVLIVVETESSGQAALLVDTISDQRQFVIKSLDTHYRAVEGVAGATILGDGQVALILDVDGLVTRALTAPVMAEAA